MILVKFLPFGKSEVVRSTVKFWAMPKVKFDLLEANKVHEVLYF